MSLKSTLSKLALISSFTLSIFMLSAQAQSSAVTIQCGDLNEAYVDMDLSESFREQFANEEDTSYDYLVAGRNCGLGSWESNEEYEVLVMFKKKALGDYVGLGPFTIKPLDIKFYGDSETILSKIRNPKGVVLSGLNKDGINGDNLSASVETKRGNGFLKVILRKIQ